MSEETLERMFDAADASPWEANEHGLWCIECGECIAPPWFFDRDEEYEPPDYCKKCGYPHD